MSNFKDGDRVRVTKAGGSWVYGRPARQDREGYAEAGDEVVIGQVLECPRLGGRTGPALGFRTFSGDLRWLDPSEVERVAVAPPEPVAPSKIEVGDTVRFVSVYASKKRFGWAQTWGPVPEVGDEVIVSHLDQTEAAYKIGTHAHRLFLLSDVEKVVVPAAEPVVDSLDSHPVIPVPEEWFSGDDVPLGPDALPDFVAGSGAVRSADVDDIDFCSFPLIGLLIGCKIAGGGGTKYGRYNYMKGFPVHVSINHAVAHIIRWINGDRSEPHLAKAAWSLLVAAQEEVLRPENVKPHVLGPGATLTPELLAHMDEGEEERTRRRRAGEFEHLFHWTGADIPIVQEILAARQQADAA